MKRQTDTRNLCRGGRCHTARTDSTPRRSNNAPTDVHNNLLTSDDVIRHYGHIAPNGTDRTSTSEIEQQSARTNPSPDSMGSRG